MHLKNDLLGSLLLTVLGISLQRQGFYLQMRCSVIDYNEVRMSALLVHKIFPSLVFLYWAEKVRQHRELAESSLQGIY